MWVVMHMSAEDSSNVVDSPAPARLGLHRVIFTSVEKGWIERFRPPGLPALESLGQVSAHLHREQEVGR